MQTLGAKAQGNWRAEASQPCRATGIYGNLFNFLVWDSLLTELSNCGVGCYWAIFLLVLFVMLMILFY